MAINGRWWGTVGTPGGSGGSSGSVSLRWPIPLNITAQVAIGGVGGADPVGEIGFSAYVQDGAYHTLGNATYGSWAHVFFGNGITQLDVSARSFDAWVNGSAIAYSWDEGVLLMQRMGQTGYHVVLIQDGAGNVVHTHEVIYFEGADQLDDSQLRDEAIEAARRVHSGDGELVATVSSEDDLERIRDVARRTPRSNEA